MLEQENNSTGTKEEEQKETLEESEKDKKDLLEEVDKLTATVEELKEKFLRALADNENAKRRYDKQLEEIRVYSITNLAKDLVTVMDNLNSAISHKPSNMPEEMHNLVIGIELTKTDLNQIFDKYKISVISPTVGEKFDYNFHHAISQQDDDNYLPGTIISVMQIGYKIAYRLLRPALVSVAKTPSELEDNKTI